MNLRSPYANPRIFRVAAMRPEPMAWPAGEVAQGWIGITTGPGGEELILAGEVTPLMEIEMAYTPGDIEAKLCGTVKLIWNSPTATSAAYVALAGMVMGPICTVTPLNGIVETIVPAGDEARPVAKSCTVSPGTALRNTAPLAGSPASLPSRKTAAA
jgi:hypothetical protein